MTRKCAICSKSDPAGTGIWAVLSGYDQTPVHTGKCFRQYKWFQAAVLLQNLRSGVFSDINEERDRQNAKWGPGDMPAGGELAILVEEVGEVATALQNHDEINLREELIQVAAVCCRWLETLYKET